MHQKKMHAYNRHSNGIQPVVVLKLALSENRKHFAYSTSANNNRRENVLAIGEHSIKMRENHARLHFLER